MSATSHGHLPPLFIQERQDSVAELGQGTEGRQKSGTTLFVVLCLFCRRLWISASDPDSYGQPCQRFLFKVNMSERREGL